MLQSTIIIKVKSSWPKHIFLTIWSLGCLFFASTIFVGTYFQPVRMGLLIPGILAAIAGILVLNHAIWNLSGYTQIDLSGRRIVIRDIRNLFKHTEIIDIDDWIAASYEKEKLGMAFRFWEFNFGDILIRHEKGERRIGKGLSQNESEEWIEKINQVISNQASLF